LRASSSVTGFLVFFALFFPPTAIFAVIRVRKVNKNRVALVLLGKDGSTHCVICNNSPVVCAVIIPANTREYDRTGTRRQRSLLCILYM
jgi:hypothetical protein